jgi:hypothetical protein
MECPACRKDMASPGTIIGLPYEADNWFCDPDESGCGTEVTVPLSAYEPTR